MKDFDITYILDTEEQEYNIEANTTYGRQPKEGETITIK